MASTNFDFCLLIFVTTMFFDGLPFLHYNPKTASAWEVKVMKGLLFIHSFYLVLLVTQYLKNIVSNVLFIFPAAWGRSRNSFILSLPEAKINNYLLINVSRLSRL